MTDFTDRDRNGTPGSRLETAGDAGRDSGSTTPSRGPVDRSGRASRSNRVDHGRAFAETVLHRSEWLSPGDRQLIRSIYGDGHAVSSLAPMLRTREQSLRRRVRKLLERINSRRFAFVAVRLNHWPATRKRVASSMVLQGQSLRETADRLGMSLYNVRRHYDVINALFEASERPGA